MPTFRVTDPETGRSVRLTGDSPPSEAELEQIFASLEPEPTLGEEIVGGLETAGTVITGAAAEPIAGIIGLGSLPFLAAQESTEASDVGDVVRQVREGLTFEPRTKEGRANLIKISETLKPITDLLQQAEQASGDVGFDLAGPVGGAIGQTIPTAIAELIGGVAGKGIVTAVDRVGDVAEAVPDQRQASILETGEALDVPVLTSDIIPPDSFMGSSLQSLSEKLGPLGSGSARASQQEARQAAVSGIAENLDIDLDTPFAADIVRSINAKSAKRLEQAGIQRRQAIDALNPFGEVPITRTRNAILQQVERQAKLKDVGDEGLVNTLERVQNALEGGNFEQLKDVRTTIIEDLNTIRRSEDQSRLGPLQAVKSAIDKDMVAFARANDRDAAAKWLRSNREFAEELDLTKRTELKRILQSGDATPEKVLPLLRGGKPSELNRLYNALGPKGRTAAQRAIIQDALIKSKFFDADETPNPNAFATQLSKPNTQQAVNVFFRGKEKAEIDGINRLLNATRRAQEAGTVVKTGEQVVPIAAGAIIAQFADTAVGLGAVATASALAKAYESTRFRNLLIKLKNTKPGSPQETRALELAVPAVLAELQAAKTAQQQREETQSP